MLASVAVKTSTFVASAARAGGFVWSTAVLANIPSPKRKGTVLEQARLPDDKAFAILKHIQEGCGTRATSRLVGVDKNTVTRYLAMAGAHAEKVHDELVAFSPSDT